MITSVPPPDNVDELWDRSRTLSGKTLADLVLSYPLKAPTSLLKAKGFIGQLIEWHLGASSENLPEPDFPHLGIELKTIPLNANGQPRESTYVCTAPLQWDEYEHWEMSRVRKKLAHVLWIPVEADPAIPLMNRRVGSPLLWKMDAETEHVLKQDWEELTLTIQLGQIENLSAKMGVYLQIRPKAAHSRVLVRSLNADNESILVNPKGFYLRSRFTQQILQNAFCHI